MSVMKKRRVARSSPARATSGFNKENDHVYQDHTGFRIGDGRHLRGTRICRKFLCAVQPYAGLLTCILGDQPVLVSA